MMGGSVAKPRNGERQEGNMEIRGDREGPEIKGGF